MSETKWTPDPWRAQAWLEDQRTARLIGPHGETIATFRDLRGDEGVANLQLCATAPTLYEALEQLVLAINADWTPLRSGALMERARSALALSRGEKP